MNSGMIKLFFYGFLAILGGSLVFKIYKKIYSIFESKSEEAGNIFEETESGLDYLQPNDWKSFDWSKKKPSQYITTNVTNVSIDWYVAFKENDPTLFLVALKRLNSKVEVAFASMILFNQYKLVASSVAQNLNVYSKAKNYILKLPKLPK